MKRLGLSLLSLVSAAVLAWVYWPREPTDDMAWDAPDTSYSPGPRGVKAFYLLLGQLGAPVSRLRRPGYRELAPGAVLWNLSTTPLGAVERRWAVDFVRRGGTLIAGEGPVSALFEEAGLGTPVLGAEEGGSVSLDGSRLELERYRTVVAGLAPPDHLYLVASRGEPAVASWNVGRGRLVFLGARDALRDDQIGKGDNGPFFTRLAFDAGSPQVFDEFGAGFGEEGLASLLVEAPYRWGLVQAAAALLVLLWSVGARRQPVAADEWRRRRRTADHVDAVARLWARAGDAGLALESLLRAAADRARSRLGGAAGEEAFCAWIAAARPELGPRACELWARATDLSRQRRPSLARARAAAVDLAKLEKEALTW